MANDIYGYARAGTAEAAFSSELSELTFGTATNGAGIKGMLVQDWNIQYQQQVQEVFELGSQNLYWVKGRPQGNGTISRVIGSVGAAGGGSMFPAEAYDICDGGTTFNIEAATGICTAGGTATQTGISAKYVLSGVLVTSVGFGANVGQDSRMMENIGWRFGKLEVI